MVTRDKRLLIGTKNRKRTKREDKSTQGQLNERPSKKVAEQIKNVNLMKTLKLNVNITNKLEQHEKYNLT